MGVLAERYRFDQAERSARQVWGARGLPGPDGVVGRSTAPLVHQFEGSVTPGDDPGLIAFRAVAADADARYLALAGRRAIGVLRREEDPGTDATTPLLRALSVWSGGTSGQPLDSADRRAGVEAILGRMASLGLVVTTDASLRICPSCGQPRSPERIIYQQEEGDTYLVRFPVPEGDGHVQALVWVDAPWRLLGASALLVNPDLSYVVARYRRRGVDERILTSRPSLARLLEWLPGGDVEVLEEGPGSRWAGRSYLYPLRHEFPMGGDLVAPAGTILAVPDVGDSGTGIVPLVPGHGGTDAQIADRLGVNGWPLVTPGGQLDVNIAHKYAGLEIPTASEFVARDLGESGALFARLRVRRGVPHCASCGTPMVWAPGRAWCLEPSRLPAERRDTYQRLLPREPPVGQVEVGAWPVSEPHAAPPGPTTVALMECSRCERLAPLGDGTACPCGNERLPVARHLLPAISGILSAWARTDPFPAGDAVWLYLNERRRAPTLVHHLAAMTGVPGTPNDIGLTLLPAVPEGEVARLVGELGADAVRAALVRGEDREWSGPTFSNRCEQESRRLERWWGIARDTLDGCDPALLSAFGQTIAGFVGELEPEDRSILARWERTRLAVLADYDHLSARAAYRRLVRFLANDLAAYHSRVRPRLGRSGTPPSRRAALRTLHHMLRGSATLLAPVTPHIAETVYGALVPSRTSLFEATVDPLDSTLLDEEAARAWDRWATLERAIERFRRVAGIGPEVRVPSVVVALATDDLAGSFRAERATVERLTRVARFEAFGPSAPWSGRQRAIQPVVSEIQRVYPGEAKLILHILQHQPARTQVGGAGAEELSVVVRGLPRQILPSMVEYVQRIPSGFVPIPWAEGEMYVELPPGSSAPARSPPPVSADALQLISRVDRELRRLPPSLTGRAAPVVITALDPLATELHSVAQPLAEYLGVTEVRVVNTSAEPPRAGALFGRSRTGAHWWVHLPGRVARPRRMKPPRRRTAIPRVRSLPPEGLNGGGEVDYTSDAAVARGDQIRTLSQELDGVLGAPLLGPSKVAAAWDAGLRSVADFAQAPFETIEDLQGFGRPIAESLVRRLGGSVPPRSFAPRTSRAEERSSAHAAPLGPPGAPGGRSAGSETPSAYGTPPPRTPDGRGAESSGKPPPAPPPPGPSGSLRGRTSESDPQPPRATGPVPPAGPAASPDPSLPPSPMPPASPPVVDTGPASVTAAPASVPSTTEVLGGSPSVELLAVNPPDSVEPPRGADPSESGEGDQTPPAADVVASLEAPSSQEVPDLSELGTGAVGGLAGPPTTALEPAPDTALKALAPPLAAPGPTSGEARDGHGGSDPPGDPTGTSVPEPTPSAGAIPLFEPSMVATAPTPSMREDPEADPTLPTPSDLPSPTLPSSPPLAVSGDALSPRGPDVPTASRSASPEGEMAELFAPARSQSDDHPGSVGRTEEGSTLVAGTERSGTPPPPAIEMTTDASPEGERTAATTIPTEPPTARAPGSPEEIGRVAAGPEGTTPGELAELSGETAPEDEVATDLGPATVPLTEGPSPSAPTVGSASVAGAPALGEPHSSLADTTSVTAQGPPTVVPEPNPEEPLPPTGPRGGINLIVAPSYLPTLAEFLDATAAGHRGVCVVRESPERLRAHVGPRPVEVYWLSNLGRGLTLRPTDLEGYGAFLHRAVEEEHITAFFLEGIEYLARLHGTQEVLRRLVAFHGEAQAFGARAWVYVHPDLISPADLALLQREFEGVSAPG